ncbi:MAG: hypothetical protein OZ927_06665 [Alcaligenaceae bacterium]|nr:hypothetical protein [Alcaligenaceae bacterium]
MTRPARSPAPRGAPPPPGPGQQGQAMVLGMLLAGVAAIVFARYFFVGQVTAARAKQLHSLDAAAYSAALIQARSLNMLAYVNRAHVGQQVAMAHLVTLGSWAMLGGTQAGQLSSGNPPAHLIGFMFGPGHGAAYAAASRAAGMDGLAREQGELARAYKNHDAAVRQVLSRVQEDIVRALPSAREAALRQVLADNYSMRIEPGDFDLRFDHDNWPGHVQKYAGHLQLRDLAEQAAARYRFLDPRDHTARNPWVVDARCPGLRHELRRRGQTRLDASGLWQSIDTESFHALRSNRWIGCYHREYAMGWGWLPGPLPSTLDQPHVDDPPDDFSSQDFWRWVKEATTWDIASGRDNPLANSRANAARQRWEGGGLPAFYDTRAERSGVPLGFAVTLRHPGPGDLAVTTRSAAETFFQRPVPRPDGLAETDNLFHPYWQARLAPHPLHKRGAP